MKRKTIAALALLLSMIMLLGACGGGGGGGGGGGSASDDGFAEKPEVTLMLTQHDPDNSLPGQYCHEWAEMVYQESKGRIEVIVNNGGSIAKPTESLSKVKDGAVDIAWGLQSFYPGQFTMTDGLTLPYLPYTSSAQASDVMMDIWENTDILQADPGYSGTKVILIRANCDAPITTAKKKLESVDDLRSMTIRASVAPLVTWLGEFGATGKGCPINELYQNLQNGAFDGALTDWHGIESFRIYDNCAKYFADEQVQYNTYYFLMNEAAYNKLSDENKAVIDKCSGQAALALMKDSWDDMTETTKKSIADNGGEVYKLSDTEHRKLADAAEVATAQWISDNGTSAQQLYDKIIELCK